jgi:hypothetical protein
VGPWTGSIRKGRQGEADRTHIGGRGTEARGKTTREGQGRNRRGGKGGIGGRQGTADMAPEEGHRSITGHGTGPPGRDKAHKDQRQEAPKLPHVDRLGEGSTSMGSKWVGRIRKENKQQEGIGTGLGHMMANRRRALARGSDT